MGNRVEYEGADRARLYEKKYSLTERGKTSSLTRPHIRHDGRLRITLSDICIGRLTAYLGAYQWPHLSGTYFPVQQQFITWNRSPPNALRSHTTRTPSGSLVIVYCHNRAITIDMSKTSRTGGRHW